MSSHQSSVKTNIVLSSIRQITDLLFPLITFPYVTRVLMDESYGRYSFASSIMSYFSMFALFGITNYAVREGAKVRDEIDKLQKFSSEVFTCNLITTFVAYMGIVLMLVLSEKVRFYKDTILCLSVSIVFGTIGIEWIYTIFEDFLYITIRSIIIRLLSFASIFIFVRTPADYNAYALIVVTASVGSNLFNFLHSKKYIKLKIIFNSNTVIHMKRMSVFFLNSVMVVIYQASDITVLGFLTNDSVVGIYAVAANIYGIIKRLINSITSTVLPRVTYYAIKDINQYYSMVSKMFLLIFSLILPIATGCFILSTDVVCVVSGSGYVQANVPLGILSIAIIITVIANVIINLLMIPFNRENRVVVASIVSSIANIALNILLVPYFGASAAACTTVVSELIIFILSIRNTIDLLRNVKFKMDEIIITLFACGIIAAICFVTKIIFNQHITIVIGAVIASSITYLIINSIFKTQLYLQSASFLNSLMNKIHHLRQ